jgi:hypothetical protein
MGGRGAVSGFAKKSGVTDRENTINEIVESVKNSTLKNAIAYTPTENLEAYLDKLKQSNYFVDRIKTELSRVAMFEKNGFEYTIDEESQMVDKVFNINTTQSNIPNGMSKDVYERYKSDGFTDDQIKQIWKDTLRTREIMENNKNKPERNITSGTYERAQKRQRKDFNSWFGRGMNK